MYKTKKLAISLLTASLLSGCASSKFEPEAVKIENYAETSGYKLGAELVEADAGWRFERITDSSYGVTLGSFDYSGNTSNDVCYRGVLGAMEGECKEYDLEFSKNTPSVGNIIIGPIIWGVGALAAPFALLAGDFEKAGECFLPIFVFQEFDWDEYSDAINEAKSAENYDERYPELYKKYVDLHRRESFTPAPYSTNIGSLTQRSKKLRSGSTHSLQQALITQLPVKITDLSGLANVKQIQNQLKQTLLASVDMQAIPKYYEPYRIKYNNENDALRELFPAKNLDDLERRIAQTTKDLASLRVINKDIDLKNNRAVADANTKNNAQFKQYQAALAKQNTEFTVEVTSRTRNLLRDFQYRLDTPKNVQIKQGQLPKKAVVNLTIKSRDYADILPDSYRNKNKDLEAHLEGRVLVITNKTGKYITVDAFSLYHNNDVLTRGGENFQNFSELAPDTVTRIPLRHFNLDGLSKNYYGLTKQNAQHTTIQYGFAIKYRITELKAPRTLYKKSNYNLYKLISAL